MKPNVHIVSYTHWDREFRWEFEHTRMKLVECLDHVFEIMGADPEFRSFHLDGQVVLLDDYLEIRPEMEETVRRHVAEGRLEIGPWYTLPDCATPHGESIVRNLQHGVKRSLGFGNVLKCGYNVFSFGQIAQLPQLCSHFGIDMIIFYKFMNPARSKYPEFLWKSPDGTVAYASRLGPEARWNYFFAGHIPIVYNRDPWHRDWKYEYGTLGKVVHTADPEGRSFFHEILDPETSYHPENIGMGFERTLKTLESTFAPETLLFFDGTDFTEPHPLTPQIIRGFKEKFGDRYNIRHSTLTAYLEELKAILGERRADLDVVEGPMRDGPVGSVHSDVVSIHPELKLANAKAETALIRFAEPLATMAWAFGIDRYPAPYLDRAWKLLFHAHVHDSIHGLGPAELGRGVMARIEQAAHIARAVGRKALNNLTKEIKTDGFDDAEIFLAVHNTAAFPRGEVVEAFVDIPAEVNLKDVVIEDPDGGACVLQEIHREKTRGGIYHPRGRNMPFYCTRVHLLFEAAGIPAMGWKTYKVKWTTRNDYPYPHEEWDPPVIVNNDLLTGPRSARNGHVGLCIRENGTFDLTNLATGRRHAGLNFFQDSGDCGNMWMADSPARDAIMDSRGTPARAACIEHGPLRVVFEIHQTLEVPAAFDFTAKTRTAHTTTIGATTRVSLRKGSRSVDVTTTINNRARDHFFKVCFPAGFRAKTTSAEGSFAVIDYPSAPDLSRELARHPAQLWFDLQEGGAGLAVLLRSTKDYEVLPDGDTQILAMSLTRGVRLRIPCDNRLWMEYPGDESAQGLGETTHEYALLPHSKPWTDDGIYHEALAFNHPLKSVQFARQDGRLPATCRFVELPDPNLLLTALIHDAGSVLVRFFNPTKSPIRATLTTGFDFHSAALVSLAGGPGEPLPADGRSVTLEAGAGKILTVAFNLAKTT
jgi:mannosylglycerate hydrolase